MSGRPILFEDFEPGRALGARTESLTQAQLDEWAALYPWDKPADGYLPCGIATVLMMRAFLGVVTPRPPGNLHAQQNMRLHDAIRSGEEVTTHIKCRAKEMKGARRKVELLATASGGDGRPLHDGIITLFWAA